MFKSIAYGLFLFCFLLVIADYSVESNLRILYCSTREHVGLSSSEPNIYANGNCESIKFSFRALYYFVPILIAPERKISGFNCIACHMGFFCLDVMFLLVTVQAGYHHIDCSPQYGNQKEVITFKPSFA